MQHEKIVAFDIPDAYVKSLLAIWEHGDEFTVGYGSEETLTKKLSVSIEIMHPENRPLIYSKAPNDQTYLNEYALRYLWGLEGDPDWGKKPEEHYTYASRMRNPIDQTSEIIKRLVQERRDRQLTIDIARPDDILKLHPRAASKSREKWEPPCLRLIDLECMNNEVSLTCYFRSWDCPGGLPINLAGLQMWLEAVVKEVNTKICEIESPPLDGIAHEIWNESHLFRTGKMIAHSKNLHIYKREFPFVEQLFKSQGDSRRIAEKFKPDLDAVTPHPGMI